MEPTPMPDPLMYQQDVYVLLDPRQPEEEYLDEATLLQRLQTLLTQFPTPLHTLPDQARHLLETSCELEIEPGCSVQWYAVRLEKPDSTP